MKTADAVILVYDIGSFDSFQNIERYWIPFIQEAIESKKRVLLVGNKKDLEREVSQEVLF